MVYQILISTMYLHFSNLPLVFMIVRLVGEAVVVTGTGTMVTDGFPLRLVGFRIRALWV